LESARGSEWARGCLPMEGFMTLVRLWCGEEGRLGGSWMMLRAGVMLPSSIVAVRCDPALGFGGEAGTRQDAFCAGRARITKPRAISGSIVRASMVGRWLERSNDRLTEFDVVWTAGTVFQPLPTQKRLTYSTTTKLVTPPSWSLFHHHTLQQINRHHPVN
jgi:hypothetical protein